MSQVNDIFSGWYNLALDKLNLLSEEKKKIGLERLEICNTCPIRTSFYCDKDKGGCGCNVAAKVVSISGKCPKDKW